MRGVVVEVVGFAVAGLAIAGLAMAGLVATGLTVAGFLFSTFGFGAALLAVGAVIEEARKDERLVFATGPLTGSFATAAFGCTFVGLLAAGALA